MPLKPPKTWRLSKEGNRPEECEDAFRVVYPSRTGPGTGAEIARAAVCDGASESAFAREWAEILANAFVDRPLDLSGLTEDSMKTWLKSAARKSGTGASRGNGFPGTARPKRGPGPSPRCWG